MSSQHRFFFFWSLFLLGSSQLLESVGVLVHFCQLYTSIDLGWKEGLSTKELPLQACPVCRGFSWLLIDEDKGSVLGYGFTPDYHLGFSLLSNFVLVSFCYCDKYYIKNKTTTRTYLGKDFYGLQFHATVHHWEKAGQELRQKLKGRKYGGMLFTSQVLA